VNFSEISFALVVHPSIKRQHASELIAVARSKPATSIMLRPVEEHPDILPWL
jgi:hypothetical protein